MNKSPLAVIINHLTSIMTPRYNHVPWWRGIHIIAISGLVLRLVLAFVSDYIYHPDEIFQYLEQGHRIIFGYGYIPWEYRFGTRSYIIPGFISMILFLCKLLQIDDPSHYTLVVKSIFCFLSISLIYSVYIIVRNIASEAAARLASVFTCVWYDLIYFAHKPTPEVLSTYLLMGALALAVSRPGYRRPLLFGLLSGLSVVLRLQYLPVLFVIAIAVCVTWRKNELVKSGLVFLAVIGMTGCLDYITWGQFFSYYYQNYLFNYLYKISELFGTMPAYFYLGAIAIVSMGIFCLTMLSSLFLISMTWLPVLCVSMNIISHSFLAHKEYRFILVSIPLLLILTAVPVTEIITKYIETTRQKYFYSLAVGIMILISVAGLFDKLPFQRIIYSQPIYSNQNIIKSYTFLYNDPDLAAILNMSTRWWETGGYYYLHRDIPIYFPNHLNAKQIELNEIEKYISHVICPVGTPDIRGFKNLTRIGNLEIRKQITPPNRYMIIDVNTRDVYQPGVDDRYVPMVKRRI
jgi:GPI mannosyltransferase 3